MSEHLKNLQDAVRVRLATHDGFDYIPVPVTAHTHGEIEPLAARLAGRSQGLCAIVMPPTPAQLNPAPGVVFDAVEIIVRVYAYLPPSAVRPDLVSLAETACAILHGFSPELPYFHSPLKLADRTPWQSHFPTGQKSPAYIELRLSIAASLPTL